MESQTLAPNPTLPDTDGAVSKMRLILGLDGGAANGSAASQSNDPMKAARQAIRSQAAAREYTERQLVQAQTAIQDLRTRLRHLHQERETTISAAHLATAAKANAERAMRAAEKALETDRANRARTEGMLRDAEATIRDLREKLATANQILRTVEAEPADERLTKPSANDGVIVAREAVHPSAPEPTVPTVRRLVGRPRKTAIVESGEHPIWPIITPRVIPDTTIPTVRRRVGRPRKTTAAQLVEKPFKPPEKPQAFAKAGTMKARKDADDDEPVQWWVEGWKKR